MSDATTRLAWRHFVQDPSAENALRWAILEARGREALAAPDDVMNSSIRYHEKVWNRFAGAACGRIERGLTSLLRVARSGKMRWKAETPVPELDTWPALREVDLEPVAPLLVRHLVLAGPERLRTTRECGDLTMFAAAAGLEALGVTDAAWVSHLVACKALKANTHLGGRHLAGRQDALQVAPRAEARPTEQREMWGGNYPLDGGVSVS